MTDLSRGARSRRSGRRPGWLLLTVLLVLAIAASSALVFTQRAELLKLAVILSLWAAAAAAFVSVIYRRQSDIDRAKARDLKLVYDLQLDREISARREYELEVESQLRRELAVELRAQAADEVASLRAELAALRNNLEILFDADLSHRPAIEQERTTVRAYSDWQRDWQRDEQIGDSGMRSARFVASTTRLDADDGSENAIIDVPEEPPVPVEEERAATEPRHAFEPEPEPYPAYETVNPAAHAAPNPVSYSAPEPAAYAAPEPAAYAAPEPAAYAAPEPAAYAAPDPPAYTTPDPPSYVAPDPPSYAAPDPIWVPPPPPEPPPPERGGRHGAPTAGPDQRQPAPAGGQWSPAGTPGSNWASTNGASAPAAEPVPAPPVGEPVRGQHSNPVETYAVPNSPVSARHSTGGDYFPPPPQAAEPPAGRGGSEDSQHGEGQGQSVAELLARLQADASPTGGGRRRRRDG